MYRKNAKPICFRLSISTYMNIKQKENIGWNMLSSFTDSCEKSWSYNELVLFHSAAVCIRMAFLKGKLKKKKGIILVRMEP